MQGLNLHTGGALLTLDELRKLPVPAATATHHPIAHHRLVDAVKNTLGNYGHEVVEEHHAVAHEGNRYFGLLSLKSAYGSYEDAVGIRNSNDRKFPIGVAFGGRVFVCSNLSFYGDHVIRRKHTAHAWRDVHGLLAEIIEPLSGEREKQHQTFELYKQHQLTPVSRDHALMELYRKEVLNITRIPEILAAFEAPKYEEYGTGTAWTLFNVVTGALTGRVSENPSSTQELHRVLDGICLN